MTNAQQRRITGAVLGILLGLVVLNISIRSAIRSQEMSLGLGVADLLGVIIGALLLAVGAYLFARFLQERKHGGSRTD